METQEITKEATLETKTFNETEVRAMIEKAANDAIVNFKKTELPKIIEADVSKRELLIKQKAEEDAFNANATELEKLQKELSKVSKTQASLQNQLLEKDKTILKKDRTELAIKHNVDSDFTDLVLMRFNEANVNSDLDYSKWLPEFVKSNPKILSKQNSQVSLTGNGSVSSGASEFELSLTNALSTPKKK